MVPQLIWTYITHGPWLDYWYPKQISQPAKEYGAIKRKFLKISLKLDFSPKTQVISQELKVYKGFGDRSAPSSLWLHLRASCRYLSATWTLPRPSSIIATLMYVAAVFGCEGPHVRCKRYKARFTYLDPRWNNSKLMCPQHYVINILFEGLLWFTSYCKWFGSFVRKYLIGLFPIQQGIGK